MDTVSVIIPYFKSFDLKRLRLATENILNQEDVEVDLIIGRSHEAVSIKDLKHVDLLPKEDAQGLAVTSGTILNRALKMSKGDYVYVSDADIVLENSRFLKEMIKYSDKLQGSALRRPPMRRLLLEDFDNFYAAAVDSGLCNILNTFDFSQEYIIKPPKTERQIMVFNKFEDQKNKIFITSAREFQEYIRDSKNKGSEPKFFNRERHFGGTFASKDAFITVGGYCERFVSWGCFDADVQWKLDSVVGMNLIPGDKIFEVIHLDHTKEYFDKNKWNIDREFEKNRKLKGPKACIADDIADYTRVNHYGGTKKTKC